MKGFILMVVPALFCGMVFTGCLNKAESNDIPTDELYVILTESAIDPAGDKNNLVFTGDDIVSFNVATGEIIFTEAILCEIISRIGYSSYLHFFIAGKPVFVPPITIHSPWSSAGADDLHFRIWNSKICLSEFYQSWEWLPEAERKIKQKEQEETHKKRKKELDVLTKYLSDTGKITERELPLQEDNCDQRVIANNTLYMDTPLTTSIEISEMIIEGNFFKMKICAVGSNVDSWDINLIDSGEWEYDAINTGKSILKLTVNKRNDCPVWSTKEVCFNIEDIQIEGSKIFSLGSSGNAITILRYEN